MYIFIPKKTEQFSVRLDPPSHARFERISKNVGLKKATLTTIAIEALVDAIERNGGKLELPITFQAGESRGNTKATG